MNRNFKSEKGITTSDIIISVILISILLTIITVASGGIRKNTKEIERKTQAMYYAINIIETAKGQDFSVFPTAGTNKVENIPELQDGYIKDEEGNTTPYYQTVTVQDYTELGLNYDKEPEILKIITATVSYQESNEPKSVTLSTAVTRRGEI